MKIKHHFFGKDCLTNRELSDRKNVTRRLEEIGMRHNHLLFVNQIHGREVAVVDAEEKIFGEQSLPKADALVTNLKNVAIAVVTADCSPILFSDEVAGIIAVTHAGWRGAKLGVIQSTVNAMKNLGAKNIKAVIGPMIQQNSYEVSQEFLDEFLGENPTNKQFFKNAVNAGKWLFDLPSYVEKKLNEGGVEKIKNLGIDTYENERDFFSFRRSTHKGERDCGRNVAVAMIEE